MRVVRSTTQGICLIGLVYVEQRQQRLPQQGHYLRGTKTMPIPPLNTAIQFGDQPVISQEKISKGFVSKTLMVQQSEIRKRMLGVEPPQIGGIGIRLDDNWPGRYWAASITLGALLPPLIRFCHVKCRTMGALAESCTFISTGLMTYCLVEGGASNDGIGGCLYYWGIWLFAYVMSGVYMIGKPLLIQADNGHINAGMRCILNPCVNMMLFAVLAKGVEKDNHAHTHDALVTVQMIGLGIIALGRLLGVRERVE